MRMRWAFAVGCVLAVLVFSPVWAGTATLTGSGAMALQVEAATPILKTPAGAGVTGEIVVTTTHALSGGLTTTFFLDDVARATGSNARPELRVDTNRLADGVHELRAEVTDGTRLVMATGGLPLHVMNHMVVAAQNQVRGGDSNINKVYRKVLLREIVWFDGREADLEKHAFRSGGQLYITLTDLVRHIGGGIVWGPDAGYIMVERGGVKVRVIPGSARVYVDGQKQGLGASAIRIENRTFVPVRAMLKVFGLESSWNAARGRLDVDVNRS